MSAPAPVLSLCSILVLASGVWTPVKADLIQYWPLNETTGVVAANSAPGGTQGDLFNGVSWQTDPQRGQVAEFDGNDGYISAGTIPALATTDNFTWAVWTKSSQTPNNNVILGNRYPDAGWIKFTTNAFEYRDIAPSFNAGIDYPDFPVDTWVHHVVTKNGPLLTYYRNGLAVGRNNVTAGFPGAPFYMGGDMLNENWAGRLDDVALWNNALPANSVAGLAEGTYTPLTAPLAGPPGLVNQLTDDFSGSLNAWAQTSRGLENNAPVGYDAPAINNGEVVLGGMTSQQYWFGNSLESSATFDGRVYSEISVRRVSLAGSGSAYRSSLWLLGDDGHYVHFSQNIGEQGWTTNVRDDGGTGTLTPTGEGNNLVGLDGLDADTGSHVMTLRLQPLATSGSVNVEVLLDGTVYAVYALTNFPASFKVILTGQARASGDTVSAVFDDVSVKQPSVANFPPSFTAGTLPLPAVTIGTAFSRSVAASASDPENNPLTFSKVSGPDWVSVSADGTVSGTPPAGETTTLAQVVVKVADATGSGTATVAFRVETPTADPALFGWWPLNETSGSTASDVSGQGNHATVFNEATGGLDADASAWVSDAQFGNVLSFNGVDGTGACATVGAPPLSGTLPVLDAASKFTWSFWCKPVAAPNNDIILGDRYDSNGAEYAPQEFIKFTGSAFEWHTTAGGENLDYADMPLNTWTHNVMVKDGNALLYYRNGQFVQGRTISGYPTFNHGIYFGGQNQAIEAWNGSLSDIRLFNGALSEAGIQNVYENRNVLPPVENTNFAISSITRAADGAVTITFPTIAGKTYIVEGSTTLSGWQQLNTNAQSPYTLPAGSPILNPPSSTSLFLRVKEVTSP